MNIRVAYRLTLVDLEHLALGGEVEVNGDGVTLVLSVDGVPARRSTMFGENFRRVAGHRVGCIRQTSFDFEDDGT